MRKSDKTELTRRKIIAAAMQEFGTKGYTIGTINNICKSGINKGLVYHNFKDKDSLYLECVKKSCETFFQYISEHMNTLCFVEYTKVRMQFFSEHHLESYLCLEARTNPPQHLEKEIHQIYTCLDELNLKVFEKELSMLQLRRGVSKEDALGYFLEIQKIYNHNFVKKMNGPMSQQEQLSLHETNIPKIFDLLLYGIAEGGK